MVGDPKHLSDLAQIEADVRIKCRRCGFEEDWGRDALGLYLDRIGGSRAWSEITRYMRCRNMACQSGQLRAMPVPFSRAPANMPRRVGVLTARTLDAAVAIVERAAQSNADESLATIELHLALLVVYRFTRDRETVGEFWRRAGLNLRPTSDGLGGLFDRIRHRLIERGWLPPSVALRCDKVWPWNSPAPRGWIANASGHEPEPGSANDR